MSEAVEHKDGVGGFVAKTRAELDKTSFPSSEDVKNTTIIVVVSVLFFAAYLFLVDRGLVYVKDAFEWVVTKIVGA